MGLYCCNTALLKQQLIKVTPSRYLPRDTATINSLTISKYDNMLIMRRHKADTMDKNNDLILLAHLYSVSLRFDWILKKNKQKNHTCVASAQPLWSWEGHVCNDVMLGGWGGSHWDANVPSQWRGQLEGRRGMASCLPRCVPQEESGRGVQGSHSGKSVSSLAIVVRVYLCTPPPSSSLKVKKAAESYTEAEAPSQGRVDESISTRRSIVPAAVMQQRSSH